MKCMYGKRIIVAMGYRNMKGLSMLQVFDKAHNSVNYTQYISMAPALHFVNSVFQNKSTVFILKKKIEGEEGAKSLCCGVQEPTPCWSESTLELFQSVSSSVSSIRNCIIIIIIIFLHGLGRCNFSGIDALP